MQQGAELWCCGAVGAEARLSPAACRPHAHRSAREQQWVEGYFAAQKVLPATYWLGVYRLNADAPYVYVDAASLPQVGRARGMGVGGVWLWGPGLAPAWLPGCLAAAPSPGSSDPSGSISAALP
jgi:hypothetical protein